MKGRSAKEERNCARGNKKRSREAERDENPISNEQNKEKMRQKNEIGTQ